MNQAKDTFDRAQVFPYDASDKWWKGGGEGAPPAKDWAHAAARGILADLTDRRGIKRELEGVDEEVRIEIVDSIAEIIRYAKKIKIKKEK